MRMAQALEEPPHPSIAGSGTAPALRHGAALAEKWTVAPAAPHDGARGCSCHNLPDLHRATQLPPTPPWCSPSAPRPSLKQDLMVQLGPLNRNPSGGGGTWLQQFPSAWLGSSKCPPIKTWLPRGERDGRVALHSVHDCAAHAAEGPATAHDGWSLRGTRAGRPVVALQRRDDLWPAATR